MTTNRRLTAVHLLDIPDDIKNSYILQPAGPSDMGLLDMSLKVMELTLWALAKAIRNSDNSGLDILSYPG
jgi:hypothetical protein